jgi:hypothetical protein
MPLDTARFLFVFEQMPVLEFVPGRPLKEWRDGDLAASLGHTYVMENQPALEFTDAALRGAVAGGHVASVRWLLARRRELGLAVDRAMLDAAVLGEHLEILKMLLDVTGLRCSPSAVSEAAARGYVEIVDIIVARECKIGDEYKKVAMLKHVVAALRARNTILLRKLSAFELDSHTL